MGKGGNMALFQFSCPIFSWKARESSTSLDKPNTSHPYGQKVFSRQSLRALGSVCPDSQSPHHSSHVTCHTWLPPPSGTAAGYLWLCLWDRIKCFSLNCLIHDWLNPQRRPEKEVTLLLYSLFPPRKWEGLQRGKGLCRRPLNGTWRPEQDCNPLSLWFPGTPLKLWPQPLGYGWGDLDTVEPRHSSDTDCHCSDWRG